MKINEKAYENGFNQYFKEAMQLPKQEKTKSKKKKAFDDGTTTYKSYTRKVRSSKRCK